MMKVQAQVNLDRAGVLNERTSVYRLGRKCKICGHSLNKYNSNKYCFVHLVKGHEKEDEKLRKKGLRIYAQARAKTKEARRQREAKKDI